MIENFLRHLQHRFAQINISLGYFDFNLVSKLFSYLHSLQIHFKNTEI